MTEVENEQDRFYALEIERDEWRVKAEENARSQESNLLAWKRIEFLMAEVAEYVRALETERAAHWRDNANNEARIAKLKADCDTWQEFAELAEIAKP